MNRGAPRTRVALSIIFAFAGVMHFVSPRTFIGIVPPWMPRAELLVALSGVAEIAGAAGLAWQRTRYWAGWGLIALLVAVFPANVQMLINALNRPSPLWWQIALWVRLPVQLLLIWLVWRAADMKHGPARS